MNFFIILLIVIMIIIILYFLLRSPRRPTEGYADTVCHLIGQSLVDLNEIPKQLVGPTTEDLVFHLNIQGKIIDMPLNKQALTLDAPSSPEYSFNSKVVSILNFNSQWDNLFISTGPYLDDPLIVYIPNETQTIGGLDVDITNTEVSNIRIRGLDKITFNLFEKDECSPIVDNNSIQYKSSFEFLAPLTINFDISTEINKIATIKLKGPITINMTYYVKGTYQLQGKFDVPSNQIELNHFYLTKDQQPVYDTTIDLSKLDINTDMFKDQITDFIKNSASPMVQRLIQETLQSLDIIGKINDALSKFDKKIPVSFDQDVCAIIDKIVDTINNQIKTSLPNGKPVGDISLTTTFGNKTITIPKDRFVFDTGIIKGITFNSKTASLVNPKSTYDNLYLSTGEGDPNPFQVNAKFNTNIPVVGSTAVTLQISDITLKNVNDIKITLSKENCSSSANSFEFKTVHQGDMTISIPNVELSCNFNANLYAGTSCAGVYWMCTPSTLLSGPIDGNVSQSVNIQLQVSYAIYFTYDFENDAFTIYNIKVTMSDEQLDSCVKSSLSKAMDLNITVEKLKTFFAIPADWFANVKKIFTNNIQNQLSPIIQDNIRKRLPNLITYINTYLVSFTKSVPLRNFWRQDQEKTHALLHFTPSPTSAPKKLHLARILHIAIIIFIIILVFIIMSLTWVGVIPFPKLLQMTSPSRVQNPSDFIYHSYSLSIILTCSFLSILCFSLFWMLLKTDPNLKIYSNVHKSLLVVSLLFGFIGFALNTIIMVQYIRKFSSNGKPFAMFLGLLAISVIFMSMDIIFINHNFPTECECDAPPYTITTPSNYKRVLI